MSGLSKESETVAFIENNEDESIELKLRPEGMKRNWESLFLLLRWTIGQWIIKIFTSERGSLEGREIKNHLKLYQNLLDQAADLCDESFDQDFKEVYDRWPVSRIWIANWDYPLT